MSLTLRQYAAAHAMAARIGDTSILGSSVEHAKAAVRYADALIAELEATPARADLITAQDEMIVRMEKEMQALRYNGCHNCDNFLDNSQCGLLEIRVLGRMSCPDWRASS